MNRKRTCVERGMGQELAEEVKRLFPGKTPKEIAAGLGIEIVYERPVDSSDLIRLSEYRDKKKQIAVFFREVEHTAIAHELFHHMESAKGLKMSRSLSEKEAEKFARSFE